MLNLRLKPAGERTSRIIALVRYAALLGVLGFALAEGGDLLLHKSVRSFDPVVMTLPIDDAVVETHRVAGSRNSGASEAGEGDGSDVTFDHARPAPRLFERVSVGEAEKIKASVRETIVAEGSQDWYHGSGGTYRTVCVRLCDGAYFPVSFSTTRNWFNRDEAVCRSRCGAPARLFVAPNPGGSPESMRDRNGASYIALPTAFQFRKGTVSGCSCRAEAWESASLERHRGYQEAATNVAVATAPISTTPATERVSTVAAQTVAVRSSPSRVAGWDSTRDLAASSVVDAGRALGSHLPAAEGVQGASDLASPVASIAVDRLDVQRPTLNEYVPQRSEAIVTSSLSTTPAATVQRPTPAERALKSLPPQVVVKARTVKTVSRRPGGNKRRPAQQSELEMATAGPAEPPLVTSHLPKVTPTWGVGPNSRAAPRGHSAYEVFARNFY